MKNFFVSFIILFLILQQSFATHIVGGELTYVLIDSNSYTYRITLKIYRDCLGTPPFDNPAILGVYDTAGNLILKPLLPLPGFDTINPNLANDPCLIAPNICVEEAVYTQDIALPPIPGGYDLTYQRCCRRSDILNIINPGNVGLTLLTHIFDTTVVKYNSSPIYTDFPPLAICVNEDIIFDHSATDAEGDSLVYELCTPFIGGGTNTICGGCPTSPIPNPPLPPPHGFVNWLSPYDDQDPLGGLPLNIDSITGLLTGKPSTIGKFVVGVCVKEYRNDTLLSTNKRDFQFNVVDCINPTAAVFDFAKICGDSTVFFPDSSTGTSSYWWDFGDPTTTSDTSISNEPTYNYPDTGIFQVTLIVNKGSACSDTATGILELRPGIDPNYDFNGRCITDSIRFFDSSFVDAGNIVSWSWDFGDGDTANILTPVHYYSNPDTYQVQLTIVSDFLCIDSITKIIIVDTVAIADIGSDFSLCGDSTITFDNFSKGATNYYWDFGISVINSDTSIIYKPNYTYSDTGFYQIMLIAGSACNTDTDYMNLGVLDGVTANFNAVPVCLGEAVVFTNTSISNSSDSITQWYWDFGNGNSSLAIDTSYVYLNDTTYLVKLKIGSSLGCTDSTIKQVRVYSIPMAILSPNILTQCGVNIPIIFSDSSINADRYHWNFGNPLTNNDTANISNPSYIYPDTGFYNVMLIVDNLGSCPDTAYTQVQLKPALYKGFIANYNCLIDPVIFIDTSRSEYGSIIARLWDFGDGNTSVNQIFNYVYPDIGPYTVKLIVQSEFGCIDSVEQQIKLVPRPVAVVTEIETICLGESILIDVSGGAEYQWFPSKYLSNSNISNPVITPKENLIYTIIISDSCGFDTTTVNVKTKFCGADVPNAFSPNGDGYNDIFKIQGEGIVVAKLKIYNRWGVFLFETNNPNEGWDGTFKGKKLSPAVFVYYLVGILEDGNEIIKFGNVTLVK